MIANAAEMNSLHSMNKMAAEWLAGAFAIGVGATIARSTVGRYFEWKAARRQITLVSDKNGVLRDPLDRKEWKWLAWYVAGLAVFAVTTTLFFAYAWGIIGH